MLFFLKKENTNKSYDLKITKQNYKCNACKASHFWVEVHFAIQHIRGRV